MQAAGSLVNQRVVEILGDIANKGDKTVKLGGDQCARRQRTGCLPESKPLRLAFDDLADSWNQALPALVIAQIQFK